MSRDTAMEHLHPVFRHKVQLLLQDLATATLPFRVFEGFRTPQRQRELYSQPATSRLAYLATAVNGV